MEEMSQWELENKLRAKLPLDMDLDNILSKLHHAIQCMLLTTHPQSRLEIIAISGIDSI
jgi:hypothetical protein